MRLSKTSVVIAAAGSWFYATAAHAAEGAEAQGSWFALIFYIINFGLFVWILRRYGAGPIRDFLRKRAGTIRDNLERAQTALAEARRLEARARELAAGLAREKTQLAADLAEETAHQLQRLDEMAREAIARIRRDNESSIAALREAGRRRARLALAAATETLARDLVRADFTADDQARLLTGFVGRLGQEAGR
ncbi:MAG TPA: ATP synthase F0 subunit B [Candidatus Binataceae bacterium]|jgi:F-type H+-transporting ATPase subunit b|nr:ATP synthase F0 subunit B [Candidatus Binataceae bacterium]